MILIGFYLQKSIHPFNFCLVLQGQDVARARGVISSPLSLSPDPPVLSMQQGDGWGKKL